MSGMDDEFDEKLVAPCTSCSWQILMDSFHLHQDFTVYGFILADYYMLDRAGCRLSDHNIDQDTLICCAQSSNSTTQRERPRLTYLFSICANSVSLCLYYPTLHRHYAPVFICNLFLVVLRLSCDTMTVTVMQQGH